MKFSFAILFTATVQTRILRGFSRGRRELVYADLPLTDYDMKSLTGSLAVLCWPAQSPSCASEAPEVCTLWSQWLHIRHCWGSQKNPAAHSPVQVLLSAYSLSVFHAASVPLVKAQSSLLLKHTLNKINDRTCHFFFASVTLIADE